MAIDIQKALQNDDKMQEGFDVFQKLDAKASAVADEITNSLVTSIMTEGNDFSISTATLAVAKTLSMISSFLYDTEDEFLADILKARTCVVTDLIPALLDPQPCGLCESCKDGNPEACTNPEVRGDYTLTKFLPIICNMLIEYDLFNKVLFMHTIGRDETLPVENGLDEALSSEENIEQENDNGSINE